VGKTLRTWLGGFRLFYRLIVKSELAIDSMHHVVICWLN